VHGSIELLTYRDAAHYLRAGNLVARNAGRVARRLAYGLDAEDASMDAVVSMFALCTVPNPARPWLRFSAYLERCSHRIDPLSGWIKQHGAHSKGLWR
jgi:hypothetical protein